MNNVYNTGDPLWIPSKVTLCFPDMIHCIKYKVFDTPICAWYIEPIDDKTSKVMYDNVFWSIDNNSIFPYIKEG